MLWRMPEMVAPRALVFRPLIGQGELSSGSEIVSDSSSETQGQLVGAGKSLNGRGKNSGEEKSSRRVRAPGDKVLTDQLQTVGAVLASDWCQKIFVFFLPNHRAVTLGVVSCFPTRNIHTRHKWTEGLPEEK